MKRAVYVQRVVYIQWVVMKKTVLKKVVSKKVAYIEVDAITKRTVSEWYQVGWCLRGSFHNIMAKVFICILMLIKYD